MSAVVVTLYTSTWTQSPWVCPTAKVQLSPANKAGVKLSGLTWRLERSWPMPRGLGGHDWWAWVGTSISWEVWVWENKWRCSTCWLHRRGIAVRLRWCSPHGFPTACCGAQHSWVSLEVAGVQNVKVTWCFLEYKMCNIGLSLQMFLFS